MKTLILLLLLVIPNISFSQSNFYKINRFSVLNYLNGEWVLEKTVEPVGQFLVVNDSKIKLVSEDLDLSYLIYGEKTVNDYKTHRATHWNAVDNKGKNCFVMIKTYEGQREKSINFVYSQDSYAFELIIEEE